MSASQSILELVAAAQATAKTSEDCISEITKLMGGQAGSDAQVEELRAATVALELAAIDIFSLFEARMQHHFRRGPFSRKLKALLVEAGQADLADRVHQSYLAINVLKHGTGASYREMLQLPKPLFVVKPSKVIADDDTQAPSALVDVTAPGFFDGLTTTILDAYHFLENRQIS
ncbi:hypothetical protein DL239_10470 [Sedimentitalea sp. CY04]|uniref:Uncharacterized protein n=1 Tax=Parasedimentitalea denitrificans TaxID=2211118 RepID=A0ABX0W9C7_9RHOB|nr:hypothetical protein [Sedimentitalea sp. CY04]NIZ61399.1 hypothetical protein [Sedimentitalea sp. CY04]